MLPKRNGCWTRRFWRYFEKRSLKVFLTPIICGLHLILSQQQLVSIIVHKFLQLYSTENVVFKTYPKWFVFVFLFSQRWSGFDVYKLYPVFTEVIDLFSTLERQSTCERYPTACWSRYSMASFEFWLHDAAKALMKEGGKGGELWEVMVEFFDQFLVCLVEL